MSLEKPTAYSNDSHLAVQGRLRDKLRKRDTLINALRRDLAKAESQARNSEAECNRLRAEIAKLRSHG